MKNPFDIMRVLSDDTLAWVEATDDMNAAKTRVCELLADSPGEYIVFNQDTKELVSHFSAHEPARAWRQLALTGVSIRLLAREEHLRPGRHRQMGQRRVGGSG